MKIMVACLPKSGSTYLSRLIGCLPGYVYVPYVPDGGRREQELSRTVMEQACAHPNHVSQAHVRASEHTLLQVENFDVQPIVLVRNIFDALLSMAEHLRRESTLAPMAYFEDHLSDAPLEERIGAVVDLAAPWYFNFYASWWNTRRDVIVTYEDIILGGVERQCGLLNDLGIDISREEIRSAYDRLGQQEIRFNVGLAGRGQQLIPRHLQDKVQALTQYYPDIDFSPIGLENQTTRGSTTGDGSLNASRDTEAQRLTDHLAQSVGFKEELVTRTLKRYDRAAGSDRMQRSQTHQLPPAVEGVGIYASGIYQDGWLAPRGFVILNVATPSELTMKGLLPIDIGLDDGVDLTVGVRGGAELTERLRPGLFELRVPILTGCRHFFFRFARFGRLSDADPREAAGRLTGLNITATWCPSDKSMRG